MIKNESKYWDRPWQLTSGCSPCSPGCFHCWSAAGAYMRQFQKNPKISGQYEGLTYLRNGIPTFNGTCRFNIERLEMPLRTKKHTVWAVWNDLFHEDVLFLNQLSTWIIMRDSKRQFFLVLTKRPDKMLYFYQRLQSGGYPIVDKIWNGLTVCTQQEADEKGPISLQIPGNKFWSLEPLLEKIDIIPALMGFNTDKPYSGKLGGVIIGPETGPHRRPCNFEWVENIVADCEHTGIPVFVKALNLNGKISTDMAAWPEYLRVRQLPWRDALKSEIANIKFTKGILSDLSEAPENSDTARLDYIASHPGVLLNLKSGVRAKNIPGYWQPSVRAAIDAIMETDRSKLRSRGVEPKW